MIPYYADDFVTIYHGDCREVLQGITVEPDLLLSDPPYGMNYTHGGYGKGKTYGFEGILIKGDEEPFDPAHLLAFPAKRRILWGANHYAPRLPASPGWVIWDKRCGRGVTDQSDCELAWSDFLTVARVFSAYWGGAVRSGREQKEGRLHVNQKPVALMTWCIDLAGLGTNLVLDPYMGSGSTLRAAKDLGRKAIGIEFEEAHCETAAKRMAQEVLSF